MVDQDEEEEYIKRRDEIEYLALFINHKAVERVVTRRSTNQQSTNIDKITDGAIISSGGDEEFANLVSKVIGKDKPKFKRT